MGGACLRGHRHPWPARRSGRAVARGQRKSDLADEPDPTRADACPKLLRPRGDADAVRHRIAEDQPDAVSDPNPVAIALRIGVALGDRGEQRVRDSVPVAGRDGYAVTVAERQRETFGFPLASP
jgi:hypothetical protein